MGAAAPLIMMAVAAAGSAAVSYASAQQQAKGAKAVAQYNTALANQDIQNLQGITDANIAQQRRENYLRTGAATAAARNLSGSALDILSDNTAQQELSLLNMQYEADMQKTSILNGTRLDQLQANAISRAARLQGAASLLGGASQIAGAYGKYNINTSTSNSKY